MCGDMAFLEESVAIPQRLSANVQSALFVMKGEQDKYSRRLSIEEQQPGGLESLIRGLRSGLFEQTCLVESV